MESLNMKNLVLFECSMLLECSMHSKARSIARASAEVGVDLMSYS